jgi:mercuric ion transport protein
MKEKLINIGSASAAFLASLCCIGPIFLAGLGLGGAGLVTGLETYRPYMMGVTFIFLGAALFMTYRKREEVCEDGTCKVRRGSKRSKVTLWIVTALAVFFLAFPYIPWNNISAASVIDSENTNLVKTTIPVKGTTCASCNVAIEMAVRKLEGVNQVTSDYDAGATTVEYDQDKLELREIVETINNLGYQASMPKSE